MPKITVFHPATAHKNGSSIFVGEKIQAFNNSDGSLCITGMQNEEEQLSVTFAAGQWAWYQLNK